MNKDVRNAFVELSLGELGRDIPRLLDYCAADVRATLQAPCAAGDRILERHF